MKAGAGGRRRFAAWVLVVVLAIVIVPVIAIPQIRWRAHLLFMTATGQIPDIKSRDLIPFLLPSSRYR